jgi:hypothetical protein
MPSKKIPRSLTLGLIEPQDAARIFAQRGTIRYSFSWEDVWAHEHSNAFTVAKINRLDLLTLIYNELDKAINEGTSLAEFEKALRPILAKEGYWGQVEVKDPATGEVATTTINSKRLQLIYDLNLRQSFAAGAWERAQRTKDVNPLMIYVTMHDERVRASHAVWDYTILPIDHSFWKTHFPPNGWRCRCHAFAIDAATATQLQKAGKPVKFDAPEEKLVPYTNSRTGETIHVPHGIDPGFGYNPGMNRQSELAGIAVDRQSQVPAALSLKQRKERDASVRDFFERINNTGGDYDAIDRLLKARLKRYGFDASALTQGERMAIYAYADQGYMTINAVLRSELAVLPGDLQTVSDTIEALISGMRQLPQIEATVVRRVELEGRKIARLNPGDILDDPSFMSASYNNLLNKPDVFSYREVRMIIHARKARNIEFLSPLQEYEREVVFLPGSRFRVLRNTRVGVNVEMELEEL